jgi:hypothetical protein
MWVGAAIAGMMILALLMQAVFAAPRPDDEGRDDTELSPVTTSGQFKLPPTA